MVEFTIGTGFRISVHKPTNTTTVARRNRAVLATPNPPGRDHFKTTTQILIRTTFELIHSTKWTG
jgi:hypothetical protein